MTDALDKDALEKANQVAKDRYYKAYAPMRDCVAAAIAAYLEAAKPKAAEPTEVAEYEKLAGWLVSFSNSAGVCADPFAGGQIRKAAAALSALVQEREIIVKAVRRAFQDTSGDLVDDNPAHYVCELTDLLDASEQARDAAMLENNRWKIAADVLKTFIAPHIRNDAIEAANMTISVYAKKSAIAPGPQPAQTGEKG